MSCRRQWALAGLDIVRAVEIVQPNFKLFFEARPAYLFARIEASAIDRETSLEYLSEVSLKCADLRMKKLLIERNIPVILDDPGMDAILGEYLRLSSGVTIALVNQYVDLNSSTEYIAGKLNAGGARFKHFDNVNAAEKWLLAQPPHDPFE